MTRLGFKITTIILLITVLLLPGCSNKNSNSQAKKPQTASTQKTQAPSEMKSIITDLEKIITGLEEKIKATSKSGLQQSTPTANTQGQQSSKNQSQQDQQGQDQQGQDQQGQDQQGQDQQGQQQQSQQSQSKSSATKSESDWQNEISSVKKIHQEWNKLEPEAIKAGLTVSARDGFESALDKLTLGVSKQDTQASLGAAIEVYGQYANLIERFDTPIPSDFYRLKYEIMSAEVEAEQKEWKLAQERIPRINEYWNHVKIQVKDEKLMNYTEYSLQDMENALMSEESDLLLIKAEIIVNNLQEVEKKLAAKDSGQG